MFFPAKSFPSKKARSAVWSSSKSLPVFKLTSTITADAAKELKLAKGKSAYAIIKAPSILIGVD
jgi:hypothetical protein